MPLSVLQAIAILPTPHPQISWGSGTPENPSDWTLFATLPFSLGSGSARRGLPGGLRAGRPERGGRNAAARGRCPEPSGMGRRLQGALAAATGGDNRAERLPQPEREPEPRGAELGLSGAGRAGPGGSHGPLGPGRAPPCRHRVAPASSRGYYRCWGCCSAAPPGLPASRRWSPPARRVSLGQEGLRPPRALIGPRPPSPLLVALVNWGLFPKFGWGN